MASVHREDVAIIGAGIAGLSASVLLRTAGLRVVCLDARAHPHDKVGESLDWSSPALLAELGVDVDRLIADEIATYKKQISVCEWGAPAWTATPPKQIRRRPLRFQTVTLHVDRQALDARLFERARALGTSFIWERVTGVERDGARVTACATAAGRRIEARWYIDASGTARVFARAMGIAAITYGRPKVCVWTYFDTPPLSEGTTFFADNRDDYLRWIWDIPISPGRTSVGLVLPADAVRDRRQAGDAMDTVLRDELARYPRFEALLAGHAALSVATTSFQPSVATEVCGSNWFMIGEAAAMPDPLTGNGVTSGIRHARHVRDAIRDTPGGGLSRRRQRRYSRHVFRLGHAFNAHIERAIYGQQLRRAVGLRAATYIYTLFAFFTNAMHARFDPRGTAASSLFALWFAGARAWMAGWTLIARTVWWCRRPALRRQG